MAGLAVATTLLTVVVVAAAAAAGITDVRCFCNLPACVTTSYMCKSSGQGHGGCFSDFVDYADVKRAHHGCLELLDSARHEQCHNQPSPVSGQSHQRSLLLCCHKDMCNHVDNPEIHLRFNDTLIGSMVNASEGSLYINNAHSSVNNYNSEVWFKAATIAVPICGVVVLFVLIVFAVKILRRDSVEQGFFQNSKQSGIFPQAGQTNGLGSGGKVCHEQLRFHTGAGMSSKKVPLLLQHHNESVNNDSSTLPPITGLRFDKNEANAKMNSTGNSSIQDQTNKFVLSHIPSSQISHLCKLSNTSNNLYRNVNLAVAVSNPVTFTTESKLYDKQQLGSVVAWGNTTDVGSCV